MIDYSELASAIDRAGYDVSWLGPVRPEQVDRVDLLLGVVLPASYKRFLQAYGGGGVIGAEVSGVEDDDASLAHGGTVVGDTKACRERFDLPAHMVVIYFHDDEICWCLETSPSGSECPVVSYNLFSRSVDNVLAPDFGTFIAMHLGLYAGRD